VTFRSQYKYTSGLLGTAHDLMDVYCCFLGATSELLEDHYLNRGAAWASPPTVSGLPPKVHVELLFVPTEAPVKTLKLGHKVYKDVNVEATGASKHNRVSRYSGIENSKEDDSLKGIACSILYGSTVHVNENKSFSRKNWEFRKLKCTKKKAEACLKWMREHEYQGFNKLGFFSEPLRRKMSCVVPLPNMFRPDSALQFGQKKWYCSELVEAALRETGIVQPGQTTASAHPEILFQELKNLSVPSAPIDRGKLSL